MSERNVALVREMNKRFGAGDREQWREVMAEDVVWDTTGTTMPNAGVYHGHEGVERFFVDWLGTWTDLRFESTELIDAGDSVASVFRWGGRGRTSGVETDVEMYGVYDLTDGKIVRYRQYDTRAAALEAAGVSDQG